MVIPDPLLFLRSGVWVRTRREFCKWRGGISNEITRIGLRVRPGSPVPEARKGFVGEDAHCEQEAGCVISKSSEGVCVGSVELDLACGRHRYDISL